MSVTLANGGDKAKRRELDFYPTPPEVTAALMEFLRMKPCVVWEPACGGGHMAEVIKRYGHEVIASDIRDTGYGKAGLDFMGAVPIPCDAIITNPPFNLSEQFIRKALFCAPVVAMLLKSQYWHAQKRVRLFDEFPPAWVLPLTWRPDFLFDARESGDRSAPTMECLWTVWQPTVTGYTRYRPLEKPRGRVSGQADIFSRASGGAESEPAGATV